MFGIWGAENAARLTYAGLYCSSTAARRARDRGDRRRGVPRAPRARARLRRLLGGALDRLGGHVAIGHNRYSTTGRNHPQNAQPLVVNYREGDLAIAHNGNLVNALELRREMEEQGSIFQTTSDTEVILHLIARSQATELERMVPDALARCQGAYSLVLLAGRRWSASATRAASARCASAGATARTCSRARRARSTSSAPSSFARSSRARWS